MKWHVSLRAGSVSIGLIASLITIIAFAVPESREWMLSVTGAAFGWIIAAILVFVAALFGLAWHDEKGRRRRDESDLSTFQADETSARADTNRRADCRLLSDLLGPWRPNCPFVRYLSERFTGRGIPSDVGEELDERLEAWGRDSRSIRNAKARAAFDRLKQAALTFMTVVNRDCFLDGEFVTVPGEWTRTQPARRARAIEDLTSAGRELHNALRNVFAVLHDEDLQLDPIPARDAVD